MRTLLLACLLPILTLRATAQDGAFGGSPAKPDTQAPAAPPTKDTPVAPEPGAPTQPPPTAPAPSRGR